MTNFIIIKTTFSNKKNAIELAKVLVSKKLCACAQIKEIESIYCWDNKVKHEEEFELSIKTKNSLLAEVESEIIKNHEYDTAQLISHEFKSSYKYQQWLLKAIK